MSATAATGQCPFGFVTRFFTHKKDEPVPVTRQPGDTLGERLGNPLADLIPCPILKTAVNMNWITPDANGNVSTDELKKNVFEKHLGISPFLATLLVVGARGALAAGGIKGKLAAMISGKTINLYTLKDSPLMHNADTGAMRSAARVDSLDACSSDGKTISGTDLSRYQIGLLAADPGQQGETFGTAELSALATVTRDGSVKGDNHVPVSTVDGLFRTNTLPADFKPEGTNAFQLARQIYLFAQAKKP